uniref:Gamma-glutamylcyclotransferase family protein n=1 Tax=Heliothis virescens TaxID=7102 RepID=A0A2A4JLL5_HELVI
MHQVFVYGTLKRGEPNHYWLEDTNNGVGRYVINGHTEKKFPLIIATKYNIPFLLYSPGDGHFVRGEIYDVDEKMLQKLDILEDHPNYYVREKDHIVIKSLESTGEETEKNVLCWVYFLKNFKPELLKRPHLESYSSQGSHGMPYMDSNNESVIDDLDDDVMPKKP